MECTSCYAPLLEGTRFCTECGAIVSAQCPTCGSLNPPRARYCGHCGTATGVAGASDCATAWVNGRRDQGEAERRQLTVMFCDLVGSTALSARLDPEDFGAIITAYRSTVAACINAFDGHIARYVGDGVLVYFGFPRAHEDDAERAVRAGLAIAEALAEGPAIDGYITQVRIGIATGTVIVGELIGAGTPQEKEAVVGETPNLAARLQELADPNGIVIAPASRRLLGNMFEYLDLGTRELKGFAQPVQAWQVIGTSAVQSRFEALHTAGVTPLVGREGEIELLARRWEEAKGGEGQVVLLSGEPGIGKSRIIEALQERLRAEPHFSLRYYCSPYHRDSALHPFIRQLEYAAGFDRSDTPERRLTKMESLLAAAAMDVAAAAPLFAELLSIPIGARYPEQNLSAQQRREQTLTAFLAQLQGLAVRQPALVLFEDAHWMDPTSQELIGSIIELIKSLPVLMLITYRPEFTPPWGSFPYMSTLTLNRFSRRQAVAMVERLTGGKALPAEVLDQIIARADGVPLFIEELTKTLLESEFVREKGERYSLTRPLPSLAIPTTLQDSLMARLDRLTTAKHVAQVGSIIGREFSYGLVRAVTSQTDDELHQALGQLVGSGLIFQRGRPPNSSYAFKHALIQEAAYDSLLKIKRREFHSRVTAAIEKQFPDISQSQPELLARHFTQAGLYQSAITYWEKAAKRALDRSAYLEVIGHVQKGLEVLAYLPDSAERASQELDLQILLGAAYRATKGFASIDVENTFIRAKELCERVNRKWQFLDVLRGLNSCYFIRGDLQSSRNTSKQALEFGQEHQDQNFLMIGHYMTGSAMFWQGEFLSARTELERTIALYDPNKIPDTLSSQVDPKAFASIHLSWTLWFLGYPDQALRSSEQTVAMARGLAQPFTLALALTWACWIQRCCGKIEVAGEVLQELRKLTAAHRFAYLDSCTTYLEGQARIGREELRTGLERVSLAITELRNQGAGLGLPWLMSLPAETYARINEPNEGLRIVSEALDLIERTGEHQWEAELYRLRGELLLSSGEGPCGDGESYLRHAVDIARRQGAMALELRAATSLVRALQRRSDVGDERALLADVLGRFTEGFGTVDLKQAKTLLAELM